ncbi:MAG: hypothetical protein C4542_09060 [Dehalococcoidia bacterium]|nr:MAG: hypothetical protein C4542_09060 [Dehalococcoidia bacterium]
MPRKYSADDRAKWLSLSEKGKSESYIANYYKKDLRTIKSGIIQARREQESREARIGLIRDALKKHQERLLEYLNILERSFELPSVELEPLSWYPQEENSVFLEKKEARERFKKGRPTEDEGKPSMLRQHLRNNRLWRAIALWNESYTEHMLTRLELQYKTISLIREKTGLPVLADSQAKEPPFVYSYNACHVLYKYALSFAISGKSDAELCERIHADNSRHWVVLDVGTIMAELQGNEDKYRSLILQAYQELKKAPELEAVITAYRTLEKLAPPLKDVISDYLALGLLPGTCSVCERIGT